MKKLTLALLLLAVPTQTMQSAKRYAFKSPDVADLINVIDGKSYGVSGTVIGLILRIRQQIKTILFSKNRYEFNGKKFSARELTKLEASLKKTYKRKCLNLTGSERNLLEQQYKNFQKKLQPLLVSILREMEKIVDPFLEQMQTTKKPMLKIIAESCKLRNREDSFMLEWASTKEGEEIEAVIQEITTFHKFDIFCSDLINFLEDLVNNCPKGWKQFTELMSQAKNQ